MMRRKFRLVLIAVPFIVLGVVGFVYFRHISSTRVLTISFKNAKNVRVVDVSGAQAGVTEKEIARIQKSGDSVRIHKELTVFVRYDGAPGYADGFENGASDTVVINPEYSKEKIKMILKENREALSQAVFSNIQNGSSYVLAEGTLHDHGTWYISTLTPTEDQAGDSDTDILKVLIKKDGDSWQLVGTPKLVFTKYNTKDIPIPVLDAVNAY